jgi:hypothetical protein
MTAWLRQGQTPSARISAGNCARDLSLAGDAFACPFIVILSVGGALVLPYCMHHRLLTAAPSGVNFT